MATQSGSHRRHDLTLLGVSRKRKDTDVFDTHRGPLTTKPEPPPLATEQPLQPIKPAGGGNRLLAGYLAHEFLTKGTLFGQRWDPAAAASKHLTPARHQPEAKEPKPSLLVLGQQTQTKLSMTQQRQKQPPPPVQERRRPLAYADVSYLLMTDGAHIPGIVNPTQLARWLQM